MVCILSITVNSYPHPVDSSQPYFAQKQKPQFPQQLSNHHRMTFRVYTSFTLQYSLKFSVHNEWHDCQ